MFTRVLVGVDGQQGGRDAIALAKQLGGPQASIALAHVYGAGLMPGAGAALLLGAELEESERLLEYARRAAVPGAQLISCAAHSIGRALHLLAEKQGFDLIVIGACRRGFIGRRLIGNDTIAVLNGAPCPVAVAPHRFASHPHDPVRLASAAAREPVEPARAPRALPPACPCTERARMGRPRREASQGRVT